MRNLQFDHFTPHGSNTKCPTIQANDHKGIDYKYNIKPTILSIYEKNERLYGVCVTNDGIRPYQNDGHKGTLTEWGTISFVSRKHQCLQTSHRGGYIIRIYEKISSTPTT